MADEHDTRETTEPATPETEAAAKAEASASGSDEPGAAAAEAAAADATAAGGDEPAQQPAEEETRAARRRPARRRTTRRRAAGAEATAPRRRTARRAAARPAARAREDGAERPVVRAQARYVRSSARKARLVCDHLRGKTVEEARAFLAFAPRAVARDWSKVLESAVANAEHNHELDGDDLVIKAAHADEGPTLKRFRPRAMGRATPIRKRTSHLTILLTPKE
jgi:ribosomal protein L22